MSFILSLGYLPQTQDDQKFESFFIQPKGRKARNEMRDPKDITINGKQLDDILKAHEKWLLNEGGERADLSSADLRFADLRSANLSFADLSFANLSSANLRYAKNNEFAAAIVTIVPDGDIIGWKKLRNGLIAKLLIPVKAKRSNATGRKCRAEYAKVLEIWNGEESVKRGESGYEDGFLYIVGKTVKPSQPFDDNRWDECSTGIHFFITRLEAEKY